MSSLTFELSSCVRASSKDSQCSKCLDICPVDTIQFVNNIPSFTPSVCVDCAGCSGVCPTSAFETEFSSISFMFDFLESDESLVSCKKNVPCIAALSAENLLSMALLHDENIILDMGHCESCHIQEPLRDKIEGNFDEVNYILESMGKGEKYLIKEDVSYVKEEVEPEPSRRGLFKKLTLKGAAQTKAEFDKAVEDEREKVFKIDSDTSSRIREKKLTDKRKFLFLALKKSETPVEFTPMREDALSFASQKTVDDSCTNCQICYRICPSGALSTNNRASLIHFDASLCVKCSLCHDVCQSDSIHLDSNFDTEQLFHPTAEKIAEFNVLRCNECGNHFTYMGGEKICTRCQIEEDEAISLHGGF